ncbi:MAG: NAD(+) synthase, partial [Deltaproteobacteria bacterium]|nr:NAD(+) synthase [Deltaproteobacteria bacterium]
MKVQLRELGMLRVAAVSPELRVGDIAFNLKSIVAAVDHSKTRGARLVVFPELALTGYTCGDLFYQTVLLEKSREALFALAEETANSGVAIVLGAPVSCSGRLFNAAVVVNDGRICGIVPKTYLPNTQEFYEERWFSNAHDLVAQHLDWNGEKIAVGPDLLFSVEGFEDCVLGVEVCEDAWVATPPSGSMAVAGATLLLNLSASPELLGKCSYRKALVESQSARCLAAYVYASAGPGESSTDLVFAGHSLIAEYGQTLAETERFQFATQVALADIDIQRLAQERMRNNSFAQSRPQKSYRMVPLQISDTCTQNLMRPVVRTPFVPPEAGERNARCQEIFSIQTTGLMKRLNHTDTQKAVVGISGGLDSTLALLVTIKAFDRLGWPRSEIKAVTMPGFGTTGRTRQNAVALAEQLGVSLTTINIGDAVRQHFLDIGQDPEHHDVTYENAQARERTQILMDLANRVGGLVVGTGDLSELALGWATYNGDHMSMYGVNSSVPKTLVRYLIEWCAEQEFSGVTSETLHDICATPVSPELIPPGENDEIRQKTEEEVGPYELHDFFLFQVVRCQSPPRKVAWLASHAFEHKYTNDEILKWLKVFYHRFFAQQFKRSCLPDGPKVGTVALSPRGDWRMPSDARVDLWLAELDSL